ncbi:unnamed protein product [Rhizophagus irregularis]|nr:unnamed protein product [Rhizophagus irregularis]
MLSLTKTTSTRMEASTVTPVYINLPNSGKIIIEEAKEEANGQDVDVIEIALPPINSKHYLRILELDGGKKVDVHEELKNDLKDQLPDNWWIVYNRQKDREHAMSNIQLAKERASETAEVKKTTETTKRETKKSDEECIKEGKKRTIGKQGDRSKVEDEESDEGEWTTCNRRGKGKAGCVRGRGTRGRVTLAPGTTPYPNNTNPKATSVPVRSSIKCSPTSSWNQYLDIGYDVRIGFNVILNQLTENDEEDEGLVLLLRHMINISY